jgi:hypothetical protein
MGPATHSVDLRISGGRVASDVLVDDGEIVGLVGPDVPAEAAKTIARIETTLVRGVEVYADGKSSGSPVRAARPQEEKPSEVRT